MKGENMTLYSSYQDTNDNVFKKISDFYLSDGEEGCDPTWGKGTFWKHVDTDRFILHKSDLATGGPCLSALPFADSSLDFIVLDPPYMDGFFRPKSSQVAHRGGDFSNRYGNHLGGGYKGLFYQAAVKALYEDGISEASRVIRRSGKLIVKCQDQVSSHTQHLSHCEIWEYATQSEFKAKDLFVVTRRDLPHTRRIANQEHARKNHSYFLVFTRK